MSGAVQSGMHTMADYEWALKEIWRAQYRPPDGDKDAMLTAIGERLYRL
jgi:hypothetical protein